MIEIDVPGFDRLRLSHFVSDYNGTLAVDGKLICGVIEKLNALAELLDVHIVTADTVGNVRREITGLSCRLEILEGQHHDRQKKAYVEQLGSSSVVAMGNGRNDRLMLAAARIGIAVTGKEGCAVETLKAADIHVTDALDGLDLLVNPKRLIATLRV